MSALRQPTTSANTPSVAALPATSPEILRSIRAAYTFPDSSDEEVALSILSQRPDVAAVLLESLPHVRAVFGDETQVMLLVVDDHSEDPVRLSARIVTIDSVPEARSKRAAFYRSWWLGIPVEIDEVLSYGLIWPRDK